MYFHRVHILLIHGALGARDQLAPLQALLSASHDVNLMELEGHGSTAASRSRYEIESFARQARTFLAERSIERTAVFGYSMGGYVALTLAAESPELVTSVATLGTKLAWTPHVAARETSRLDPATIRAKVPKFAASLEQRHAGAGGWESVLAKTSALMTRLGASPTLDAAKLAGIAAPARLMVGDRDNVVSAAETLDAARSMPNGQGAVLPGTPHPFEQVRLPLLAGLLNDFFV